MGCLLWLAALHRTSCPSLPSCLGHRSRLKMGSQSRTGSEGDQSCHFASPELPVPGLPCLHTHEEMVYRSAGVTLVSQWWLNTRALTTVQHQCEGKANSQGSRKSEGPTRFGCQLETSHAGFALSSQAYEHPSQATRYLVQLKRLPMQCQLKVKIALATSAGVST